jgi:hypothetical protein
MPEPLEAVAVGGGGFGCGHRDSTIGREGTENR